MASTFDPTALADRIIRDRNLDADSITRPGSGRLDFSPSMVGDAAYIRDQVRALSPAEREILAATADASNSAGTQAAYKALHIDPSLATASTMIVNAASAALALLIAQRLHVNVPV